MAHSWLGLPATGGGVEVLVANTLNAEPYFWRQSIQPFFDSFHNSLWFISTML
jgi:hypothetical protein